ncbi:MAG: G5 domain-containing protein [Faecousia sp.]
MYHYAKSGKKRRRKKRLLRVCFLLAGVWAAALWWLLSSEQELLPLSPVNREPTVTLVYRGEQWEIPAAGQTAGELLESLGLELTQEDVPSAPADTVLSPGEVFTVELHQRRQEVYTLVIPPETEYRPDDTLPWGKEAVLIAGIPGEMRCTAQVDYVNGLETRREITGKQLLYTAQKELIAVGTCENPGVSAGSGYLWLPDGQLLTYTHTAAVEATAFTGTDAGALPNARPGTVAVDPDFIAPGTRLYIASADGSFLYGIAQARASTSMQGSRVDLYFSTADECADFGRQMCTLYFLG